ncbi:hypothetical protein AOLI_G00173100 [Acnodon oligacanthus]
MCSPSNVTVRNQHKPKPPTSLQNRSCLLRKPDRLSSLSEPGLRPWQPSGAQHYHSSEGSGRSRPELELQNRHNESKRIDKYGGSVFGESLSAKPPSESSYESPARSGLHGVQFREKPQTQSLWVSPEAVNGTTPPWSSLSPRKRGAKPHRSFWC